MNIPTKLFAGTLGIGIALSSCGEQLPAPIPQEVTSPSRTENTAVQSAEAYLPSWLTPQQNQRIARIAPHLSGVTIAFALPSASGEVQPPTIESPRSFKQVIGALSAKATVSLAIGGWGGDDAAHEAILQGFAKGAKNPQAFAKSVKRAAQTVEAQIDHKVNGIDIDWEYPTAKDTKNFAALLLALRAELPGTHLSIAAPAYDSPESHGLTVALKQPKVRKALDQVHVMTYDQHGPWEATAGSVVSGDWAKKSIKNWADVVGEAKVSPGYAAYCYEYLGAKASGQAFKRGRSHPFSELPTDTQVIDQPDTLSSVTEVNGNWTSCQSPRMAAALDSQLREVHPKLGAPFFWSAEGLVEEYVTK